MDIPVLEIQRLVLRPHRLDDFDACSALWGDPRVVRYILGVPRLAEETWSRLLRYRGHWEMLGYSRQN